MVQGMRAAVYAAVIVLASIGLAQGAVAVGAALTGLKALAGSGATSAAGGGSSAVSGAASLLSGVAGSGGGNGSGSGVDVVGLIKTAYELSQKQMEEAKKAVDTVVGEVEKSTKRIDKMVDEQMDFVNKKPNALITQGMMKGLMKEYGFKRQKAGTRSITLRPDQGFSGINSYQPSGWHITESFSGPKKMSSGATDEKVPVYSYPKGVGPVLINNCMDSNYSAKSPCYSSKKAGVGRMTCPRLLDASTFIGVGFDGRGYYKIESRRASLVQRTCLQGASFMGNDVPDAMKIFGIFETVAETKSFSSADEYMKYIREKAGLSNQKNLFESEASQHGSSKSSAVDFGGVMSIVGAGLGAAFGGAHGAQMGAKLGGAVGATIKGGSGTGSGSSSSTQSGSSESSYNEKDDSRNDQSSSTSFFASMYISVILYEVTLDDVKPTDLNLAALKDYMSLPVSYYSVGADVKYQNFLMRWGTHYIRSAKFGGQLKITKTAKANKIRSVQEFSSIAQTEFQSMFASLQSKYSQETTTSGFLFWKKKKTKTSQSESAKKEDEYQSEMKQQFERSQSFRSSEFTNTVVEAQGGTPLIAEALIDFYTPAFRQLYRDWITSIKDYIKPFEFQLKGIDSLFNMNMDDLFPSDESDFGCLGSSKLVKILTEPGTNRRYYLDERTSFVGNETIVSREKVYCKYKDIKEFKTDLERRRISLERSVAVYMAEGPFPTSSFELAAGQPGCEEASLAKLNLDEGKSQPLTFAELKKAPFLIAFDLPQDIPSVLTREAKYKMLYRDDRWFATDPENHFVHLYDGCQLTGYKPAETKICFRNIILTYEEKTGFFHVGREDFAVSKQFIRNLPAWLSASTVARAKKLEGAGRDIHGNHLSGRVSIPCNVKWQNSHRLDPDKPVNCIHFTAASQGDIFLVFSSIPRDHTTWYYLQISKEGVSFYQAMKLQKRDIQKGIGILGDSNLYQTLFVCVIQVNGTVLMQYGKADADSELGKVYSAFKFFPDSQYSILSFYAFGAGAHSVSLMDIRLTRNMPEVECLNTNYRKNGKHCVLNCHRECLDCSHAHNDKACFHCVNDRVESLNADGRKVTQCVPECPAGYQLSDSVKHLCVKCPAGSAKDKEGNHKCQECSPGSFNSALGAIHCTPCAAGTNTSSTGSKLCKKCPPGTAQASQGSETCQLCEPGSFAEAGQQRCSFCSLGSFANSTGQGRCHLCSEGTFAAGKGQTKCTDCPAGTSSAEGSMSCENNCPKGWFSPSAGIACKKCPPGTFSEAAGSSNCSVCKKGSFQPEDGKSNCNKSPAGGYVEEIGASQYKRCPVGTANAKVGQIDKSSCKACPAGTVANSGSPECVPCRKGYYQPSKMQSSCIKSPSGAYVDEIGAIQYIRCPMGTANAKVGQIDKSACKACPAGTVANSSGSPECIQCPKGHYQPRKMQSSCIKSPAGAYNDEIGATRYTRCPVGTSNAKVGQIDKSSCKACPAGTMANSGSPECVPCTKGYYQPSKMQSSCMACPPGTYSSSSGWKSCSKCNLYYSLEIKYGMSECEKCPHELQRYSKDKCYEKHTGKRICEPQIPNYKLGKNPYKIGKEITFLRIGMCTWYAHSKPINLKFIYISVFDPDTYSLIVGQFKEGTGHYITLTFKKRCDQYVAGWAHLKCEVDKITALYIESRKYNGKHAVKRFDVYYTK